MKNLEQRIEEASKRVADRYYNGLERRPYLVNQIQEEFTPLFKEEMEKREGEIRQEQLEYIFSKEFVELLNTAKLTLKTTHHYKNKN